jgi:hypothetical protein
MRQARQVVARIALSQTPEPPERTLVLDASLEDPKPPPPLPKLGAAARIREALSRWLEEDM